jgi:hypothetical protein
VLADPIPANTTLVTVEPAVTISNPAATGLTFTYTAIDSTTDNVEFSSDGGATYSHQPDPSSSTDSSVTHIRFRPTGVMNGASGGTNPSFTVTFMVVID